MNESNLIIDVPEYVEVFNLGKKRKYCVVIFVINEGDKLLSQLSRMKSADINADIVLADGGSTDGSTKPSLLQSFGVSSLLVKTGPGKLGSQMRMAFSWAISNGYEGVVVIDGNNKDSVENVNDFIVQLENGFDHIQGSRFIPGGKAINTPKSRLLGLKLLHVPLMRLASGFKYTDTTNGFRAYSKKFLSSPSVSVFRSVFEGYELHYYLALKAPKLGFKCIEIPVTRTYPKTGKTPTKISPIKGNLGVINKLFRTILNHYDP
ncbi:glycosyl transferase family 2 [Enterovibrio norvegicus]|uniref:glycosyltransferase family 2 protein n=1 Tax=Enterovibrio norvegicus TaxID=188144 RepID=UPI0002E13CBC|nr:glycosyltransferase family 2 protein [Enterovibrio norvegicus]OEE68518.1 glycosyl transferase family 2 [Enterovibrio norvegicus]